MSLFGELYKLVSWVRVNLPVPLNTVICLPESLSACDLGYHKVGQMLRMVGI